MRIIRIEGRGSLPVAVVRGSGGNWVAICEPFAVTVQSETWAALMDDLAHTLNALLSDLLEDGELEAFLSERGFHALGPLPQKPDDTWFDVPFSPTMTASRDSTPTLH